MGGVRNSTVLLILAAPFALYAAWQLRGVSRADLLLFDPPPDRAASKEQLATTRGKTERWTADVRKAASVTHQFRAPGPDDAPVDGDCTALVRAATKRSADLTDLEQFLAGTGTGYTGTLRAKFIEWDASRADLSKAEKAVEEWFAAPLATIDSSEGAAKAIAAIDRLIAAYSTDARFSDPAKVAAWKARARIEVIKALDSAAEAPFSRALDLPLPLPTEAESADVGKALGAPRAIREQVKALQDELIRAEDAQLKVPDRVLADAKAAAKRADEWSARARLLALFAEPTLFTRAAGASDWLARVNAQFDRVATAEDQALLRRKVQEYCETFVPAAVLLDDAVLLDGKRVPRAQIDVKYFPANGAGSVRAKLAADPDRKALTEFTVAEKHPGDSTLVLHGGAEHYPKQLKPTALSTAAVHFSEARREVGAGAAGPKWTAKSLDELKNKCKPHAAEINKLGVPGGKPDAATEIWTRIESLAKGAEAYKPLFEKGQ